MKINKQFRYALLATEILKKREAEGLTLRAMAAQSQVPVASCYRAEANSGKLDIDTVVALCNWLEVPIQKFFTFAPDKRIEAIGSKKKGGKV